MPETCRKGHRGRVVWLQRNSFYLSRPINSRILFSPGGGHRHGPADGPTGHPGPAGRLVAARRGRLRRPGGPGRASLPGHVHAAADQRHASAGERRDVNDGLRATVVPGKKIPDVTFNDCRPVGTRVRADCAVLLVQMSKRLCSKPTEATPAARWKCFLRFYLSLSFFFKNQFWVGFS